MLNGHYWSNSEDPGVDYDVPGCYRQIMTIRSRGAHRRPARIKTRIAMAVAGGLVTAMAFWVMTPNSNPVSVPSAIAASTYVAPRASPSPEGSAVPFTMPRKFIERLSMSPGPYRTTHEAPASHVTADHDPAPVVTHSYYPSPSPSRTSTGIPSGTLSCSGLEALWIAAGGNPSHAFIAAEIAMAESGGRQYAHSPTDDWGYWQINGSHGTMASTDPLTNAKAAISISSDGTNWSPWTTYTSGAYAGRC